MAKTLDPYAVDWRPVYRGEINLKTANEIAALTLPGTYSVKSPTSINGATNFTLEVIPFGDSPDSLSGIIQRQTGIDTTGQPIIFHRKYALGGFGAWVSSHISPTLSLYVDKNRSDSYTPDGSIDRPYKSFAQLFAVLDSEATAYVITVTPGDYVELEAISLPAVPFTIYGNRAKLTIPSITINAPHVIYDLDTVGVINYAYTGSERSKRTGGSITGDVNISGGFPHFENLNYSGLMTITAGNPYFRGLTGGGRVVLNGATAVLSLADVNMNNNSAVSNIAVMAGRLIINGGILINDGTVANVNISNSNTMATAHAISGLLANWVACSGAYTLLSPDSVFTSLSGTKLITTQYSGLNLGVATGTAQAQVVSAPVVSAGYPGFRVVYRAIASNTGAAPTLSVNYFDAKPIIRGVKAGAGTALVAGDIVAGMLVDVIYDGTNWLLMNPQT